MQAAVLSALVLSKISRFGSIGASLCRMASLDRTVCKRLVLLIALCLLFSLIPVAGSALDSKDAKESVSFENMLSMPSVPDLIVASQISARGFVSGAMAGNAHDHIFEVQTSSSGDAQGQSARKLLHTFSKPDQDTIIPEREDYQMKTLNKEQPVVSHARYIKAKRFQLLEAIEKKTHHKKHQNVISHGLIRVRPIQLIKAVEEETYPEDHQRRALEASTEITALQWETGLLWRKEESNRVSKLSSSSSHFGLGLTREQEQIHNVVAALRRAGLFGAIAGTIEGMNLFMLPQMATIFVPTDSAYQALKQEDINFQLFQYHIVMQRYAFSQLCRLREGDILYTLLPGYSIIVTGEPSPFKISLDGVSVIAPDLYVDQSIAVHGIYGIFNCTMYGKKFGDWHVPEAAQAPPANISDKQAPPPVQGPVPSSTNGSVAGVGEAGQHDPAQQSTGTIPTPTTSGDPNTFPFSFSPLASDTDASDITISAKIGACAAATAFLGVLSILCS